VISFSQSTINGKILDVEKAPISNAFIKIKGSSLSTYSSVDGDYTITIPSNQIVIIQISISTETLEKEIGTLFAG
jgi:uncharacterized 2Fe-2S/4Fe-4S cluster protein (DUF4445 family)